MSSRRNFFIRAIGALLGDIAVGAALAAGCAWVIQAAALGAFLSFLAWLAMIVATLALSQYVVHPLTTALLSDRKLDDSLAAVRAVAMELARFAEGCGTPPWDSLGGSLRRYAGSFTRR